MSNPEKAKDQPEKKSRAQQGEFATMEEATKAGILMKTLEGTDLSLVDSSDKCNTPFFFECVVENFIRGSVPESLPGSLV